MNLSIKNVPEDVVYRLKHRARVNHRSLQGELMSIIEESVGPRRLSVREVYERAKARNLNSPSESTQIIRELRDSRERELYERVTGKIYEEPRDS